MTELLAARPSNSAWAFGRAPAGTRGRKDPTPMANTLFQERTEPRSLRLLVPNEETALNHRTSEPEAKHEERLRHLLEITNILPWEADAESGRFTYVGEQAVRILGYPAERWYEPGFWASHVHPDDLMRAAAERLNQAKEQDSYELEYRMVAGDGRTVWLQDIDSVIRRGGPPAIIRGFLIDITERKRTEEALHSLQTKAQEISAEIHRLSYRLHPSKLDHLGLAAAVKSLCDELSGSCKLK